MFAKVFLAQKAAIDFLTSDLAYIKKLVTSDAFLDNLVTKRLKVDSVQGTNQDFECTINEDKGILATNKGKKIFEITPGGSSVFTGEIRTSVFDVIPADENIGLVFNFYKNVKVSMIFNSKNNGTYYVEGKINNKDISYIKLYHENIKTGEDFAPIGMWEYWTEKDCIEFVFRQGETEIYSKGFHGRYYNGSYEDKWGHWDDSIPFEIKAYERDVADMVVKFKKLSKGEPVVSNVLYYYEQNGRKYLCIK